MKDTEELERLRLSRPHLFDVENPVEGLAACNAAAADYQKLLRALGTLKRSYSARIAKSPLLAAKRAAEKAPPVSRLPPDDTVPFDPRPGDSQEYDDMLADLAKEFSAR